MLPLALLGCQRSPEAASLVGTKEPPHIVELEKETIIIGSNSESDRGNAVRIEVSPTNRVFVGLYKNELDKYPFAEENFKLAPIRAKAVRNLLWRLRPGGGKLGGYAVPIGCQNPVDTPPRWVVTFYRAGDVLKVFVFNQPPANYCVGEKYREANRVIRRVLNILPQSPVMLQFNADR